MVQVNDCLKKAEKIRGRLQGEPNGTGIMSEATKQKMSKSHIGKKDSEETKQKKSQSAKDRIKSADLPCLTET